MVFIPSRWPPVIRLLHGIFLEAFMASFFVFIFKPVSFSASEIFGVVSTDFGRRYLFSASARSSFVRLPPEVATITGSTTAFKSYSVIFFETSFIISGE